LLLQPHSKLHASFQGAGRNDYARDRPDAGCIQSVEHQGDTGCSLQRLDEEQLDLMVACISNAIEKLSPPIAPELMPIFTKHMLHRRGSLQTAIDSF
jgi:hypothetical protein